MDEHVHMVRTRSNSIDLGWCRCGYELGRRDRKKFKPPTTAHGIELAKAWATRPKETE